MQGPQDTKLFHQLLHVIRTAPTDNEVELAIHAIRNQAYLEGFKDGAQQATDTLTNYLTEPTRYKNTPGGDKL